jgi:uncharacterized protein (DUF1684 family)
MKINRWILILIPILLILIYLSLPKQAQTASKSTTDSLATVESRKNKDENFKVAEDSPIPNKATFKGLHYYPYNAFWSIMFDVTRAEKTKKIAIQMTDGSVDSLILFGKISSNIKGEDVSLLIYQHDSGDFFIPFKDKTAPTETYGGGRYLELPLTKLKENQLLVDFNQTFFPFCAYNGTFACPIPPRENVINIRIEAGERNP